MYNGEERRKYPRIDTHIPVKFRKLSQTAGASGLDSISKDLSEGGIRIRTPEFIAMAMRLILEMRTPVSDEPLKVIFKVAWIRKDETTDEYELGGKFLEMSKDDKKALLDYISGIKESASSNN